MDVPAYDDNNNNNDDDDDDDDQYTTSPYEDKLYTWTTTKAENEGVIAKLAAKIKAGDATRSDFNLLGSIVSLHPPMSEESYALATTLHKDAGLILAKRAAVQSNFGHIQYFLRSFQFPMTQASGTVYYFAIALSVDPHMQHVTPRDIKALKVNARLRRKLTRLYQKVFAFVPNLPATLLKPPKFIEWDPATLKAAVEANDVRSIYRIALTEVLNIAAFDAWTGLCEATIQTSFPELPELVAHTPRDWSLAKYLQAIYALARLHEAWTGPDLPPAWFTRMLKEERKHEN